MNDRDELCDRFESACLAGAQPRIEEFLIDVPVERRDETVRELLKVDAHYRRLLDAEESVRKNVWQHSCWRRVQVESANVIEEAAIE